MVARITGPTSEEQQAAEQRLAKVWAPELARREDRDRLNSQAETATSTGGAR